MRRWRHPVLHEPNANVPILHWRSCRPESPRGRRPTGGTPSWRLSQPRSKKIKNFFLAFRHFQARKQADEEWPKMPVKYSCRASVLSSSQRQRSEAAVINIYMCRLDHFYSWMDSIYDVCTEQEGKFSRWPTAFSNFGPRAKLYHSN